MASASLRNMARRLAPAALALLGASSSLAAVIPGSAGFTVLSGNDPGNPTGSFRLEVAYEIYDGASATDPLGANGLPQVAFVLNHTGAAGENPARAFGRFSVFAPDPSDVNPFYTSIQSVNPGFAGQFLIGPGGSELDPFGGIAPSSVDIDPPPGPPNRGEFFFLTGLNEANFLPGQHSRLLVLTMDAADLPTAVVIEADRTDTVPSIDADTIIPLIPEPSTGLLGLMGVAGLARLRRRA